MNDDLDQGFEEALKLTEEAVNAMVELRFPSAPPDRPGWWRCMTPSGNWIIAHVFVLSMPYVTGVSFDLAIDRMHAENDVLEVHRAIADGWQFAGRVEMPGEE